MEELDVRTNCNKVWCLIRKFNYERPNELIYTNVIENIITSQLLLYSKTEKLKPKKRKKITIDTNHEINLFYVHFTIEELNVGIKTINKGKAV